MDKEIFDLIKKEEKRQQETLMMIASENYTYPEVKKAVGSVLMSKYSEGQVGARYYQGNENIDEIERICKERVLDVFGLTDDLWGVNVQAHSGSPANLAIFNALLKPGDKILSMYLPDGGHLSHGWKVGLREITLSSKIYDIHFYNTNPKTGKIDYVELRKLARKVKPKLIVSGGTAYPDEIQHSKFSSIANDVGAYYLADVSHEAGLIAARANNGPFPYCDVAMMTTHKTLRGPRGAIIVSKKDLSSKIDSSVFPGIQGGPHNHTIAGIAVALKKTEDAEFRNYAHLTINNARRIALLLSEAGFKVISGSTKKHLVLVDLRSKKINGAVFARALERVGIIVNKNTVPEEDMPPMYPSGIRIGAQAISARGMKRRDVEKVAKIIIKVAKLLGKFELSRDKGEREAQMMALEKKLENDKEFEKLAKEVHELCMRFPAPI